MTLRLPLRHAVVLVVALLLPLGAGVRGASRAPVRAAHGMVGSTSEIASRVGVEIMRRGGSAVDAAVAVGFALAVTYPAAGNLGGGGLMLIRFGDGRATAIDYREIAPAAATRDMFLDVHGDPIADKSLVGPLAAGVPGSVAGLALAHRKYGRLPFAELVAPAIALAETGFDVEHALSEQIAGESKLLQRFPDTAQAFLPGGRALEAGSRFVQKDLARTLRLIAAQGEDGFYRGEIANLIVAEMQRTGGLITQADLVGYAPIERPPLTGSYRDYGVVAFPPVSSGGVALIQLLNILEGFPLTDSGPNSSRTIHMIAEAEKRVYADRSEWLGDPAFFRVPLAGLLSKRYAAHRRAAIDLTRATPSREVRPGSANDFESVQTTHYSIVDADGTAVSTTTTLNGWFGNGQMVRGAGFLLNNEMDDFSAKPGAPNMYGLVGGEANAIAPRKRMVSSMTPTIVTRSGKSFLVVGSPGGPRIITTVLQVILNVIDHGMNVQEAVDAPRFHHQWLPDELRLERQGFPADVVNALNALGHQTSIQPDMGDVHAS
ncbi:MAG: gamma-glutamyltransferase [Acidobacteria bacterium]|nr:gamma-glutamyltransferase [Acidobacteriota bacterium]